MLLPLQLHIILFSQPKHCVAQLSGFTAAACQARAGFNLAVHAAWRAGYIANSRGLCDERANTLSKRRNTWQSSPTPFSWARCHFNDADLCSDRSWVVIRQLPPKTHQRAVVKDGIEEQRSILQRCYAGDPPHPDTFICRPELRPGINSQPHLLCEYCKNI